MAILSPSFAGAASSPFYQFTNGETHLVVIQTKKQQKKERKS